MPAQHLFTVIRASPRAVTSDEFDPLIFANFSRFPGIRLLPDAALTATVFRNISTFGRPRLVVGPSDGEIDPPVIASATSIGATTVSEAPPDGVLRPGAVANTSGFGEPEISEAPADGVLRPASIANAQTFGTVELIDEGGESDDDYGPIAYGPLGGDPL